MRRKAREMHSVNIVNLDKDRSARIQLLIFPGKSPGMSVTSGGMYSRIGTSSMSMESRVFKAGGKGRALAPL